MQIYQRHRDILEKSMIWKLSDGLKIFTVKNDLEDGKLKSIPSLTTSHMVFYNCNFIFYPVRHVSFWQDPSLQLASIENP